MDPVRILFLQLPQLDADTAGGHENVPLAAGLMSRALRQHSQGRVVDVVQPAPGFDRLDDAHRVEAIVDARPDVIAATLYLWNVERTLAVLQRVRERLPRVRIAAGGPEVSHDHPFLLASDVPDVLVEGEGEPVVTGVVAYLSGHAPRIDLSSVGVHRGCDWVWGGGRPSAAALSEVWPPPDDTAAAGPDAGRVAYLETSRGCPLRCTYCCYNQRRATVGFMPPRDVGLRLAALEGAGVREVRFIDPTFNGHPAFEEVLETVARVNRRRRLICFAEVRAETLTPRQVERLAAGGFTEIEVGVQSLDPAVLRAIRRPTRLEALKRAVQWMSEAGIRLTLDVMGALPLQRLDDVRRTLDWVASVPGAHVQFMHTLALPGTELRRTWAGDLRWQRLPPYRVLSTRWMSAADLRRADEHAEAVTGRALDARTPRFVGRRLAGLFPERVRVDVDAGLPERPGGRTDRRAVILTGADLFAHRHALSSWVLRAVRVEPHILWQFVLSPEHEEPIDLLDGLARTLRRVPLHVLDRSTTGCRRGQRVSRRVLVQLRDGVAYDPGWQRAAEDLLGTHFL